MCNLAAAAFAMQAGSQLANYRQAQADARTQNEWNRMQFESNRDFALADYNHEQVLTRRREAEEQALIDAEVENIASESARVRGTAAVTAAESGARGGAATSVIKDFLSQEIRYRDELTRRGEAVSIQASESLKAAQRTTRARILGAQVPDVPKPNFTNTLLAIGGAGIGTWDKFYKWDKTTKSWVRR